MVELTLKGKDVLEIIEKELGKINSIFVKEKDDWKVLEDSENIIKIDISISDIKNLLNKETKRVETPIKSVATEKEEETTIVKAKAPSMIMSSGRDEKRRSFLQKF